MVRRLVLLRHAKSAWPSGVPDHDRPLAGKGRRNAQATGGWFATEGPRPDLVLCSDALRARQTWEIAAAVLTPAPACRLEPALYGAAPDEVIELARGMAEDVGTLVLVSHEPTMSQTADLLAGRGSDAAALRRLHTKFPTNGVAVLRFTGSWSNLGPGQAVLEAFAVPRAPVRAATAR
jgi:phosphohistidine phosphatase